MKRKRGRQRGSSGKRGAGGLEGKDRKPPSAWRAGSPNRSQRSPAALLWLYFCLTFLKTKLALLVGQVPGQQGSGMAKTSGL